MSITSHQPAATGLAGDDVAKPVARLRPVGRRELLIAWLLLLVLGVAAYTPHILDGGFYLDDWSNGAGSLYPPSGGALSYFVDLTGYRPVLVGYVPLTYFLFGTHMGLHLAWAAFLGIVVSALLFGILRTIAVPRTHAWMIAALVLVFPWFDSTRMWATASQVTLGVALAAGGLWLALIALRRRSWPLHVASLALFVTSILTYEIALALIAMSGLLYVWAVGFRAARTRWAADLVVALAGAIWVASQTKRESSGLSGHWDHLQAIVTEGGKILGRAGLALGDERTTLVLLVLAGLAAIALVVWFRDRAAGRPGTDADGDTDAGTSMSLWLGLGLGGLAVTFAGWVMFVPADPYYTPSVYGFTNRVNGLAGVGLVLVVYAGLGVVGALVGRVVPAGRRVAAATTLALALVLGVTYMSVLDRHGDAWDAAYRAETAGIARMKSTYPTLPDGTTLFTTNFPANQTLGVPIFSTTWDVDGLVKLEYRNGSLRAFPMLEGGRFVCEAGGIRLTGPGEPDDVVPYGQARLLDVTSGGNANPRNRKECLAWTPSFAPGPTYLKTAY